MPTTKKNVNADAGSDQGAGCGAAPHRVRLSRRKGWKMPENTISVARPGRWGNPFTVGMVGSVEHAVTGFRELMSGGWCPRVFRHLRDDEYHAVYEARLTWMNRLGWRWPLDGARQELSGKNLACWCPLDQPCHADVLLTWANDEPHNNQIGGA